MKTLKQVEQLTGIKADNLRQRIARGTLKADKLGRDWFLSDQQLLKLVPAKRECQDCLGIHEIGECEATNGKMD